VSARREKETRTFFELTHVFSRAATWTKSKLQPKRN
jgi:hypothetical protein